MNTWTYIKEFFTPVDVAKNHRLIAEYWEKDRIRKIAEAKIVKYSSDHYTKEGNLLKKKLDGIGATEVCTITENVDAPKLQFNLNGKTYVTNGIYDFTCENVMMLVNEKLK